MVANAFSRKSTGVLTHLMVFEWELLRSQLVLIQRIKDNQLADTGLQSIKKRSDTGDIDGVQYT